MGVQEEFVKNTIAYTFSHKTIDWKKKKFVKYILITLYEVMEIEKCVDI